MKSWRSWSLTSLFPSWQKELLLAGKFFLGTNNADLTPKKKSMRKLSKLSTSCFLGLWKIKVCSSLGMDFQGGSVVRKKKKKTPTCQCRRHKRHGCDPWVRGGHGNPVQYSCLENHMDRGAWWATVHRVTKNQT